MQHVEHWALNKHSVDWEIILIINTEFKPWRFLALKPNTWGDYSPRQVRVRSPLNNPESEPRTEQTLRGFVRENRYCSHTVHQKANRKSKNKTKNSEHRSKTQSSTASLSLTTAETLPLKELNEGNERTQ